MIDPAACQAAWIATRATVTSCRFQFARLNTFTLGVPTSRKFLITFDYHAHSQLYSDQFQSSVAIAQNKQIDVLYNPLSPEQNSLSHNGPGRTRNASQPSLISIGIAGSVILSLLWLLVLRTCN